MTEKELKESLKDPVGVYFFYGEEDYLKRHYVSQIKSAVLTDETFSDFNEIIFDDATLDTAALEQSLYSPPVMADKKLILVSLASYQSLPEKQKSELLRILPLVKDYPDTVVVLSVGQDGFDRGSDKKPSGAMKAYAKFANCVYFPLGDVDKLTRWLARHFAKDNIGVTPDVLALMIRLCGRSMYRLSAEAEKVSVRALAEGRSTLTAEFLADTVSATPEEEAFMLSNALIRGDAEAALEYIARAKGRKENPVTVLASVNQIICDMALAVSLASEGEDRRSIAAVMGTHEFRVKLMLEGCAGVSAEAVAEMLSACAETELKMKSTAHGYEPLERLVCAAGEIRRRG